MHSSKRIAWQRGNFATFAEIEVELHGKGSNSSITAPQGLHLIDARWRPGVLVALSLLNEKMPRISASNNTQVVITASRSQPGDTTTMAVAYVMFHAIAEKLAPELLKEFIFDEEEAKYIIMSPNIT